MKRSVRALLIIFLCISCADEKKDAAPKKIESLSFTTQTIEKKLDDCLPENGDCTFISLTFPVAQNGSSEAAKINREIEDFILNTIDYQDEGGVESPEELAENFIEDYKETANDFPESELAWEATITGEVNYSSPQVISMKFKTNMFTGGAHGYQSINYLNFDPENGKILTAGDLFTPEFSAFVEEDFRKKQNIPAEENINSTGMLFEDNQFHLPDNIGITENSVILHYNAYDIAPYSAGNFILTYTRSEIPEYLKINPGQPTF